MNFGRHRLQTNGQAADNRKTIDGNGQLTIKSDDSDQEATIILFEREEKKRTVKKSHQAVKPKPGEPIILDEIKKEEIKPHKKVYEDNTGLVGQNTTCRDFRAIIKKKGLKINEILNKMLHEWNTENYNL
jgi:hypothetical protein